MNIRLPLANPTIGASDVQITCLVRSGGSIKPPTFKSACISSMRDMVAPTGPVLFTSSSNRPTRAQLRCVSQTSDAVASEPSKYAAAPEKDPSLYQWTGDDEFSGLDDRKVRQRTQKQQ